MCGIFGYIGPKEGAKTTLEGLKKLEYRGYDSAGLAGFQEGRLIVVKEVGKISELEKEVSQNNLSLHTTIAHTRWATHGKPSQLNAHPHFDQKETIAVVHNGIIENFEALKKNLIAEGVQFRSETDTEVIPNLIAKFYRGDLLQAVQTALPFLKGAFAIAVLHQDHPDKIVAVGHEAPLVIGIAPGAIYLASDAHAMASYTKEVIYLSHSEIAILQKDKLEIYDSALNPVDKKTEQLLIESHEVSKGNFPHFTLKEIFEQPNSIRAALLSRFDKTHSTAIFDTLEFDPSELLGVNQILIVGCGTSWHAGYVASYFLEEIARIPTHVEIASELRYKNAVIRPGTLVIAISQSGETADTLAAVKELRSKGSRVLGICNVANSSLARESDGVIFLRAGAEIGVCSTKAFSNQVIVLALLTVMLARMRHMTRLEGSQFLEALKALPEQVQKVLDQAPLIEKIAKKYAAKNHFFFIGRNMQFPAALEGALKLKEISYISASGYPAGELKHGPIALIDKDTPTVALMANKITHGKILSNLQEIKARGGPLIVITDEANADLKAYSDDIVIVPETIDPLAPILSSVACQLLAYYIARERGCDIDQPRNLAKSVTVE